MQDLHAKCEALRVELSRTVDSKRDVELALSEAEQRAAQAEQAHADARKQLSEVYAFIQADMRTTTHIRVGMHSVTFSVHRCAAKIADCMCGLCCDVCRWRDSCVIRSKLCVRCRRICQTPLLFAWTSYVALFSRLCVHVLLFYCSLLRGTLVSSSHRVRTL